MNEYIRLHQLHLTRCVTRRTQLASFSHELQMSEFKSALVNVTLSQQPTLRAPLVHTSARYSFPMHSTFPKHSEELEHVVDNDIW